MGELNKIVSDVQQPESQNRRMFTLPVADADIDPLAYPPVYDCNGDVVDPIAHIKTFNHDKTGVQGAVFTGKISMDRECPTRLSLCFACVLACGRGLLRDALCLCVTSKPWSY